MAFRRASELGNKKSPREKPLRAGLEELPHSNLFDFCEVSRIHVLHAVGDQHGCRVPSYAQHHPFT